MKKSILTMMLTCEFKEKMKKDFEFSSETMPGITIITFWFFTNEEFI